MDPEKRIRVLCVEDEPAVVDYIFSLLDETKYKVEHINDGKQALDFLLTTTEPPDIILLDNLLPSLNGLEILKELKKHKKKYALIFLTVDETLETAIAAMKEGALDYLAKSKYLKNELVIKIEKAYQIYQDRQKNDYYEEQLAMLSMAVEQGPNSVIITDTQGNIEYVNQKFTQYTGYTFDEVKGKNPRIFKTDNYDPGFFEKLWATITSGRTWTGEFINQKKNGELFYEKAIIRPVRNKKGDIVSYFGVKEDITELKTTETALKKKTDEIDRFFIVGLDLMAIIDNSSNKFIRINKAWETTLGYTIDEMINKPYTDFVHPEDLESTKRAVISLNEKGILSNFVNRYRCKNGTYRFIEWSSVANNDGVFYTSARDITERKLNEQALKESEDRFRGIFEMANAGIFFADKNGQITMVNKAFEDMTEYNSQELRNMDFSQLTHPEDLAQENELLKELIFNEIDRYRIEKRYTTKTGKIIWADVAVTVILNENNEPVSYVGVVKDITIRKEYEKKLKDIIAAKDKFFSIISHDLRNQFSSLLSITGILKEDYKDLSERDRDKFISLLQLGGQNALALLEDLLKWSRSQINNLELKKERIDLRALTEKVLESVTNQATLKHIEVVSHITEGYQINADRQMISTVLRNLINNAIKFTPSNGHIWVDSKTENDYDIISVTDNGVGMPKETIQKLFRIDTKYSTLGTDKEIGTGLGLILCKEFIDKHGGNITVLSEVGIGSEFVISLPVN